MMLDNFTKIIKKGHTKLSELLRINITVVESRKQIIVVHNE